MEEIKRLETEKMTLEKTLAEREEHYEKVKGKDKREGKHRFKGKEKPSGKGASCGGCGRFGHAEDACWWGTKQTVAAVEEAAAAAKPEKPGKVERIEEVSNDDEDRPWCLRIEVVSQSEANDLENMVGMISDRGAQREGLHLAVG